MCEFCNQDMRTADGCVEAPVVISGVEYARIKFGDEENFTDYCDENSRCGECNVKYGHYHHPGCDLERCPVCGLQLISCDCEIGE